MAEMFIGVLSLVVGYFFTLWGWRYQRWPDMLNPESLPYRVFVFWWQREGKHHTSETLLDEQIRIYAWRCLFAGIMLDIAGSAGVIMGIMTILYPDL